MKPFPAHSQELDSVTQELSQSPFDYSHNS